ncbi:hypothetical protein ACE6H2_014330 [Prunus campanulata]
MIAVASKVKKDSAFTGASVRYRGRDIEDGVLGEGELVAGCVDGVGEGCGGDDKDTMEN